MEVRYLKVFDNEQNGLIFTEEGSFVNQDLYIDKDNYNAITNIKVNNKEMSLENALKEGYLTLSGILVKILTLSFCCSFVSPELFSLF